MIRPEPTPTDRIAATMRALILRELPELVFAATYEYAVTAVHADGSIDGTVTDAGTLMPDLNRVPFAALVCGGVSQPTVGTLFLVDFVNADGARYAVVSASPTVRTSTLDAEGTVNVGPSAGKVNLGPAPSQDLARVGDRLTVFWPVGLLNGTLATAPTPTPVVNVPIQMLTPAPALISYGNAEVQA